MTLPNPAYSFATALLLVGLSLCPAASVSQAADRAAVNDAPGSYAAAIDAGSTFVVSVYSKSEGENPIEEMLLRSLFGDAGIEDAEPASGAGVIVSENGYILTLGEIVADVENLTTQLADGRVFQARVVGTDSQSGLALIKIDANELPRARFAGGDRLERGAVVFSLGGGGIARMGIVSIAPRSTGQKGSFSFGEYILTDMPLTASCRGGALLDASGEIVGINAAIRSDRDAVDGASGAVLGSAIASNWARRALADLLLGAAEGDASGPSATPAPIDEAPSASAGAFALSGVTLQTASAELKTLHGLDPAVEGVIVTDLSPDSPYANQLAVGMAILRVNKPQVSTPEEVSSSLVGGRNMLLIAYGGVRRWISIDVQATVSESATRSLSQGD